MDNRSKEVERWQGVIADLNKQREAKQTRIEKLQERKKPISLRAHTGDDKAREKLGALNVELLTERQALEDLEEVVRQVEAELTKAMEALAAEQEAERLRMLSGLAEKAVEQAAGVDRALSALRLELTQYGSTVDSISRHFGSSDLEFYKRIRSNGRIDFVVGEQLSGFLSDITRNAHDPRAGKPLEVLEKEVLSRLLIDPDRAGEIAGVEPTDEPKSEPESRAA